MANFVLIHGAWHGAWCWDELIPQLEALGHKAVAIDLPGGGADTTPPHEVTLDACARRVAEAVKRFDGPVWLAGHSLGGASITAAADLVPDRLAGLVYITAGLPANGQPLFEAMQGGGEPDKVQEHLVFDEATGSGSIPAEHVVECFYHLCSPAQVDRARRQLREWQALGLGMEPIHLTEDRGGQVPRYYVECLRDQAITVAAQRRMYRAAGVKQVATLDADHSPFWSRPVELARTLDQFARA